MNSFVQSIIHRHAEPSAVVKPRLPGVFEPHTGIENSSAVLEPVGFEMEEQPRSPLKETAAPAETGFVAEGISSPEQAEGPTASNNFLKEHLTLPASGRNPLDLLSNADRSMQQAQPPPLVVGQTDASSVNAAPIIPGSHVSGQDLGRANEQVSPFSTAESTEAKMLMGPEKRQSVVPNAGQPSSSENPISASSTVQANETGKTSVPLVLPQIQAIVHANLQENEVGRSQLRRSLPGSEEWLKEAKTSSEQYLPEAEGPTIKISIGRIEVKAAAPSAPPPKKPRPAPKPRMSLEDYLNRQNGSSK